jgi:HSP20 family molecular chaperone IbpA
MEMEVKKRESTPTSVERTRNRATFIPNTDIYETKEALVLMADMPGVDEKSVDIHLEKGILKITGTVSEWDVPEGFKPGHMEFQYGDYERAFTLSDEINSEKIEAVMKNGVLKLTLPKAEKVKARKIPVKID